MSVLTTLRNRTGLTQHQVAVKMQVDTQFVSNIERGVAPLPPKHFPVIAKLYNVKEEKLIRMSVKRYEAKIRAELEKTKAEA